MPTWQEFVDENVGEWFESDGEALPMQDVIRRVRPRRYIAILDRNDHAHDWRKVFLRRATNVVWQLHNEEMDVLDEPESGCPAEGFEVASILADVGMDYYKKPEVVRREKSLTVFRSPLP